MRFSSEKSADQRKHAAAAFGATLCALLAAFLIQACSGATTGARTTDCSPVPEDSAFLENGRVYRECAVDRAAKLTTSTARIDYRPSARPPMGTTCYVAELEFVVDARGTPEFETVRVVRTNEQPFAQAVVASLPSWRYEPALIGDQPVRQIVTEKKMMALSVTVVGSGETPRPPRTPLCG